MGTGTKLDHASEDVVEGIGHVGVVVGEEFVVLWSTDAGGAFFGFLVFMDFAELVGGKGIFEGGNEVVVADGIDARKETFLASKAAIDEFKFHFMEHCVAHVDEDDVPAVGCENVTDDVVEGVFLVTPYPAGV